MGRSCVLLCAFLCFLPQSSSAPPTATETKLQNAKLLAQVTITRLQARPPQVNMRISGLERIPNTVSLSGPDSLGPTIEGLHCYVEVLRSLGLENTAQIQADVEGLWLVLKSVAQSWGCSEPQCSAAQQLITFLRNNTSYKLTISHVVLEKLISYLQQAVRVLDNASRCTS
uniref:Leptin n=1 Tax=Callorhinchus milii TaxID=7868 RepID=A0A4W3H871_CALMI